MADALRFFAAEVEVYRPGAESAMVGHVLGSVPIGAVPPDGGVVADSTTLRASDVGYVTPLDDAEGLNNLVYVPTLAQAIAVDRSLSLSIGGAGAAVAWGGLRLNA